MKKIIILLFIAVILLATAVSPTYASKNDSLLPPWFTNAIQPIKDTLNMLISKANSFEARIADLEKKTSNSPGFDLPNLWGVSFYEDRFIMNTPLIDSPPGAISLPNIPIPVDNNCRWHNAVIDWDTSVRAIAHLSTGDIYGTGSCRGITFRTSNIPPSGTTFEADIYVFWQGTEKHKKQTITVPDRPFPKYGSLNLTSGIDLTSGIGGVLYLNNSPIGIGISTSSSIVQLIIDCGTSNCSDLWRINN